MAEGGMFGKISGAVGGGSTGKIGAWACTGCLLIVGALIFIIAFAFMARGEPMDLQGGAFESGEALFQVYNASESEMATNVEGYIKKNYPTSPLAKEGMGTAFIESSLGNHLQTKYQDERYKAGVYLPLLMAISFVETKYATDFSKRPEAQQLFNAFNATENGQADGKLLSYDGWKSAIADQGRYLIDNYFKSDNTACIEENTRPNYKSIACMRGEDEHWANLVNQEVVFIENYGVFQKMVYTKPTELVATGPCDATFLGSPNQDNYYQFPDNLPFVGYRLNTPSSERWGEASVVHNLITVYKSWYEQKNEKLLLGDINASGHISHKKGLDVDVFGGPIGTNRTEDVIALAKLFISSCQQDITIIGYTETSGENIISTVNQWAIKEGFGARMRNWDGHRNHFHIRFKYCWGSTYPSNNYQCYPDVEKRDVEPK